MMYCAKNTVPAYLFIGSPSTTIDQACTYIQKALCIQDGCNLCTTCKAVAAKQHSKLLWLCPEKQYTLSTLEPLFHTITFALEPDDCFFIVLERADFLPPACANSLLKSLEEPPAGYHFILLAARQDLIIPTIQSRCIIKHSGHTHDLTLEQSPVAHFFTFKKVPSPAVFLQTLEKNTPGERETFELIDQLLVFWNRSYQAAFKKGDPEQCKKIQVLIVVFKKAFEHPPMPGSSKLFWKNLFIQFCAALQTP